MSFIEIANNLILLVNIPMLAIFTLWTLILLTPSKKEDKKYTPKISVLIPAYNEEHSIGECLDSVIKSRYPTNKLEIIVIDDGSTDKTSEVAKSKGVTVIKTRHIGKSRALNRGLRRSSGEIVFVIDSDIRVKKDTLQKLAAKFIDKNVGVVTGMIRVRGNGIVERFQKIEFAYVSTLIKHHYYAGVPIPFVYGAISAFRRKALDDIGGFKWETAAEDSDTYLEIVSAGWRAATADTIVTTKPMKSWVSLINQRTRWMYGGLQVFFKHIRRRLRKLKDWYVVFLFGFWPFGAGLSLSINAYIFSYWFRPKGLVDGIIYILRWISFVGVPLGLKDLPLWGYPIAATTGILVGLTSMLVLFLGLARSGEQLDLIDIILAIFYPVYGWLILGTAGIIALIKYIKDPRLNFSK